MKQNVKQKQLKQNKILIIPEFISQKQKERKLLKEKKILQLNILILVKQVVNL